MFGSSWPGVGTGRGGALANTEITQLLEQHAAGEEGAFDELIEAVYADLHRYAHRQLAKNRAGSLNTTGLVHEAYLKLVDSDRRTWQNRSHFYAIAALTMRGIVVDYARHLQTKKRGGAAAHETAVDERLPGLSREIDEVLAVNEALDRLQGERPELVQVVEGRYFAGLSEQEVADAMGASLRTTQRRWQQARQWLRQELAT